MASIARLVGCRILLFATRYRPAAKRMVALGNRPVADFGHFSHKFIAGSLPGCDRHPSPQGRAMLGGWAVPGGSRRRNSRIGVSGTRAGCSASDTLKRCAEVLNARRATLGIGEDASSRARCHLRRQVEPQTNLIARTLGTVLTAGDAWATSITTGFPQSTGMTEHMGKTLAHRDCPQGPPRQCPSAQPAKGAKHG
jgi:hypothetical protein